MIIRDVYNIELRDNHFSNETNFEVVETTTSTDGTIKLYLPIITG